MKFQAIDTTTIIEIALLGGAVLALAYFVKKQSSAALDNVSQTLSTTLNPMSDQNAAYSVANGAAQAVTGDPVGTLGTGLYDGVQQIKGWLGFDNKDADIATMLTAGTPGGAPLTTATGQ